MSREDDPEARIRELERSLNDQARASELGAPQSRGGQSGGPAYLPPPVSGYTAPDYSAQNYGAQGYSAPTYGSPPTYGTQPYGQPYDGSYTPPRRARTGGVPWIVFGVMAVVLLAGAASAVFFNMRMSDVTTSPDTNVSTGGTGSISIPSMPSTPAAPPAENPTVPAVPGVPGDAGAVTATPDTPASVSSIDSTQTVTCTDGSVTVSGIRNTVNITGHCVKLSVSGINNTVIVDNTDAIDASGFDNRVTFHSGAPQINSTDTNIVEQG